METQQVRRLFLALVIAFSIICITQQMIQSKSEAQPRPDNNMLIHLSRQMHTNHNNSRWMHRWILLKQDLPYHTQTLTNDQVSYLSALKNNKVMLVLHWKKKIVEAYWGGFGAHSSVIAAFTLAQRSLYLNDAGVKSPLEDHLAAVLFISVLWSWCRGSLYHLTAKRSRVEFLGRENLSVWVCMFSLCLCGFPPVSPTIKNMYSGLNIQSVASTKHTDEHLHLVSRGCTPAAHGSSEEGLCLCDWYFHTTLLCVLLTQSQEL